MMIGEVPVPRNPIIDLDTGLTLNWPAEYQLWPGWWIEQPDLYATFVAKRQALSIYVLDFADSRFMPLSPEEAETEMTRFIDEENALAAQEEASES